MIKFIAVALLVYFIFYLIRKKKEKARERDIYKALKKRESMEEEGIFEDYDEEWLNLDDDEEDEVDKKPRYYH